MMSEFSRQLLEVILRPSGVFLIVLSLGLLLSILRWRRPGQLQRAGRWLTGGAVALLLVLAYVPLERLIIAPLEWRFPPLTGLPPHVDGIIVLGGEIDMRASLRTGIPTMKEGASRMTSFLMLARAFPQARLVFSGGGQLPETGPTTEADVAAVFFSGLGLDPARIAFERQSQTTRENAVFSKAMVRPKPGEVWLLVETAIDVPRAIGCFRQVGWTVTPVPVGYITASPGSDWDTWNWPDLGSMLTHLDRASHEWLGLAYYRWQGWTDALLPAPLPAS